jgi:catechol 2,3-dioxygenase-like lactoylglutathione lyase family enzyme
MALDLFAGIPVSDLARALAWYEQLLGFPPAFHPNDNEAVWELAEHRYHGGPLDQTVSAWRTADSAPEPPEPVEVTRPASST